MIQQQVPPVAYWAVISYTTEVGFGKQGNNVSAVAAGQRHGLLLGGKGKVYLRWQQDSASAPTTHHPHPCPYGL